MAKDDNKFFPSKLRAMLDQVEGMGLSNGSSWVSEGHAFAIHDPDVFMVDIAPRFFDKQSRLRSFHRQLSIWGFSRLETGAAGRGVWFHKHFIRDKPELIKLIKRVPVKNPKQTAPTLKNQLPDYTNYQIPSSETQPGQHQPGPPQGSLMPHPPAVHPPHAGHHMPHPGVSAGQGMPPSYGLPPPGLDYLSTLAAGRLPPVLPPQYYSGAGGGGGAPTPASIDQARRYHQQSIALTNQYPPNLLRYHSAMGGYLPPQGPPAVGGADIGDVAQQLSALRNNPSTPGGGPGGQQMDGNMDSALLDYLQDSRRQNHPPPPPPQHDGAYPPPGPY